MINIIYCYTNKINQKKYVGQTNNEERRKKEHLFSAINEKDKSHNTPFHKALRKYGEENFDYEILEVIKNKDLEYVTEREVYWILEKNSLVHNGYNVILGQRSGKPNTDCRDRKFSEEDISNIKEKIKQGISFSEIQKEYDISSAFLSNINYGKYFKDENETYPLYNYVYLEDEKVKEIIYLLKNTDLSYNQIAKKVGVAKKTAENINYGNTSRVKGETFPIRKMDPRVRKAREAIDLLMNTDLTKKK